MLVYAAGQDPQGGHRHQPPPRRARPRSSAWAPTGGRDGSGSAPGWRSASPASAAPSSARPSTTSSTPTSCSSASPVSCCVAAWRMLTGCPTCTKVGESRELAAAEAAGIDHDPRRRRRVDTRTVVTVLVAGTAVGFLTGPLRGRRRLRHRAGPRPRPEAPHAPGHRHLAARHRHQLRRRPHRPARHHDHRLARHDPVHGRRHRSACSPAARSPIVSTPNAASAGSPASSSPSPSTRRSAPAPRSSPDVPTMTDRARGWVLVVGAVRPPGRPRPRPHRHDLAPPVRSSRAIGTAGRVVGAAAIVVGAAPARPGRQRPPRPDGQRRRSAPTAPYRFVRHPIYTGVLVLGAALALTGRSAGPPGRVGRAPRRAHREGPVRGAAAGRAVPRLRRLRPTDGPLPPTALRASRVAGCAR